MNPEEIKELDDQNQEMIKAILVALLHLSRKNYDAATGVLTQSLPFSIRKYILLVEKQSDEACLPPADE